MPRSHRRYSFRHWPKLQALQNGEAGDEYTGLDRFGRVVDQCWRKTSNGSHTDRFKYGYDRDSNRLYHSHEVNHDLDELHHANGVSNGYDPLTRRLEGDLPSRTGLMLPSRQEYYRTEAIPE